MRLLFAVHAILFQVTAAMNSEEGINGVRPSLGLAWADVVTMRLMLTREEGVESCGDTVQKVSEAITTMSGYIILCSVP